MRAPADATGLRGTSAMKTSRIIIASLAIVTLSGVLDALQNMVAAQVGTIIVTTRKREENIQDLPMSVNAFTAVQIRDLGVDDLSRISDFTPNFSFEKFGARRGAQDDVSRPVIRGQSNILGQPNAAFFIDGILFSENILSFPFQAVERVEVIKGPQAALYGRSTFAGAVNFITKRGSNEFENNFNARAASHGDYELSLTSRGPVVEDKLFYFIGGRYYSYEGEYRNELDDRKVGQEESWSIFGSLEFRATDDITAIVRAGYYEDDDGYAAEAMQDRFFNNCFLDQARQYFCGEVKPAESARLLPNEQMGNNQGLRREVFYGSLSLEWDINGSGWVFTSNSGWTIADSEFGYDASRLGDPLNFGGGGLRRIEDIEREEWSTEIRFSSPDDKSIRGLIGGYYYERDFHEDRLRPIDRSLLLPLGTKTVQNVAVFGAVEVDVIDAVTVRGEVRAQSDTIALIPDSGVTLERTFEAVLPRFTVEWDMTDTILAYASAAKGNKPGDFNSNPLLPQEFRFAEEEKAWSYEVGLKSDLLDGRARFNLSAYHIDWTNQQLTTSLVVSTPNGPTPIAFLSNAGKTRVWGMEVEGNIFLTDQLEFGVGYGLSDARFTENCDVTQGQTLTGFDCVNSISGFAGGDVSGNKTPNSPTHQGNASATYTRALLDDVEGFLRADYSYRSKIWAQVHNLAHTGDRHLLNFKAGITRGNMRLTFFVDNVLDDLTQSTLVRFVDLANLNIGPQANPAQNNVPGSSAVERSFLHPLADGRKFGVTFDFDF